MQLNKENVLSIANKTSSSFYSTSSFNRRLHTMSTFSNTRNLEKYSKTALNNYHKAFLKHKLSNNEKKFLTIETDKNPIFLTKMINITDLFLEDNEISERYKTLSKESFIPIKLSKFNIYDNLSPRKENIIDFRNLIRSGRKAKIYLKILEREKNNFLESKKAEIENYDMKIFEINYVKDLLNKYIYQLGKYCKFLNKRIEKENLSLRKILLHELEIKNLVNELRTKVEHKKRIVLEGENYRNFLLCVKYKVTKMSDLPIEILKLYHLEKYIPIINQPKKTFTKRNSIFSSRKSFDNFRKRRSSFLKKKTSVLISKNSVTENSINEKSLFKKEEISSPPPLIYNSVVFFDNDFGNIKNELYKLFTFNNEQIKELYVLRNERNNLLKEKQLDDEKKSKIIKELEFKLKHVKNENSYLENSIKSINLTRLKTGKIFDKIISIITKLPINIEKEYNCHNFYFHLISKDDYFLYNGFKHDTILYSLSILEQILSSTITKINAFNKGIKNSLFLSEVKSKLEKEKRLKISKINMKLEKEKIIKRNENIIQKFNKVLFLPRRKINTIVNKETINSRNKSNKKFRSSNTYDINIENLLY